MFTWYWLADLCLDESLDFILGHALYMKAIHGGKNKDDRIDSEKIARLMRGGTFPLSYVYPREMRATRDLLRRRTFLMRRRSELLTHVQLVNHQYNFNPFEKRLQYATNRDVLDRFTEESARHNVEADLEMIGHYDTLLQRLSWRCSARPRCTTRRPGSYYERSPESARSSPTCCCTKSTPSTALPAWGTFSPMHAWSLLSTPVPASEPVEEVPRSETRI